MLVLKLLAYDISDNALRTHIADTLLAIGFERIQESVYAGKIPAQALNVLLNNYLQQLGTDDKLSVIDITEHQLRNMVAVGMPVSVEELLEEDGTIVF